MDVPSSERILYQARLKAKRDARWHIESARDKGYAIGYVNGFTGGGFLLTAILIRELQSELRLPHSPYADLATKPLTDLQGLAVDLKLEQVERIKLTRRR